MLLMIDNYDSFTYNIVQYLGELGEQVLTHRNDQVSLAEIERLAPQRILVSPGPCAPDQAGISLEAIRTFAGRIPILGVCLGHQAIGQVFGGRIVRARRVMHGKIDRIRHDGRGVFAGLPAEFDIVRYHSLAIEADTLPGVLQATAWSSDGEIMAVRHRELDVEGVQFHPESIAGEHGHAMFANFLGRAAGVAA